MVQSVELVFDPETEAAVRGIWTALAQAGARSPVPGARPHATLTVAAGLDPTVEGALAPVLGRLPLPCRIGAVLVFGRGAAVLTRLLVPSAELLELQAEVYRRCLPFQSPGPMPNTHPGQWTPHVTLARQVGADHLGRLLPIAARPAELIGSVTGIRRWDGDARCENPIR